MTETELYELLVRCLRPQLDAITVKLDLDDAFLPGPGEAPATRASAILKLVKPRGAEGLADLEKALNEVLGRKAPPEPKRPTGRASKPARPRALPDLPGGTTTASPSIPQAPSDGTQLRTIRIFLASSEELREDRDAFELYFRQQNDQFRKQGVYLEINRWENFLDAMSETRLQDEYNEAVRNCDVFVSLFFTRTGKFTAEEFDTAHTQFTKTGKPRIYTYFKDAYIKTGSAQAEGLNSLWAFQKKLVALGHFYTVYDNIEHLKRHFRDQLDKLLGR
jgi:hypothetical protein